MRNEMRCVALRRHRRRVVVDPGPAEEVVRFSICQRQVELGVHTPRVLFTG